MYTLLFALICSAPPKFITESELAKELVGVTAPANKLYPQWEFTDKVKVKVLSRTTTSLELQAAGQPYSEWLVIKVTDARLEVGGWWENDGLYEVQINSVGNERYIRSIETFRTRVKKP